MPRPTLAREKRQEGGWLWEEDFNLSCQCLCSGDIRMWLGMCRTEETALAPEISASSMFCLTTLSSPYHDQQLLDPGRGTAADS